MSDPLVKTTAYLSLGSNMGQRSAKLREGLRQLEHLGAIVAVSSLYETEPVEVEHPQSWFLNCAVAIATELTPEAFLEGIRAIERRMGRERHSPQKEPRTLDIDIILFGDVVVQTLELEIPHPAMHRRRFVLEPMVEIAPDVRHPLLKQTMAELRAGLPAASGAVHKFAEP